LFRRPEGVVGRRNTRHQRRYFGLGRSVYCTYTDKRAKGFFGRFKFMSARAPPEDLRPLEPLAPPHHPLAILDPEAVYTEDVCVCVCVCVCVVNNDVDSANQK